LHENEFGVGRHFQKNGMALLTLAKAMDSLLWTGEVVLLKQLFPAMETGDKQPPEGPLWFNAHLPMNIQ